MPDPVVFQVSFPGAADQEVPTDLAQLGFWQTVPASRSFAAGGPQPGMVWKAELPGDAEAARLVLTGHAQALRQTERALAAAGPLLERDLRQGSLSPGWADQPFTLEPGADPAAQLPPEGLRARQNILARALDPLPDSLSFNLGDDLAAAGEVASRFAGQVSRLVNQFALVESSRGGQATAWTRVEWLGDVQTWWAPGRPQEDIAAHQRVLAQALATRQAWLRLVLVFAAGAAKIGMEMAAAPFNPIAVWTAWNYIQKVIEQYRVVSMMNQGENHA